MERGVFFKRPIFCYDSKESSEENFSRLKKFFNFVVNHVKFLLVNFDSKQCYLCFNFAVAKSISAQSDGDKDLQEVKQRILNLGDETAQVLKKQVYHNYQQFIDTAKEISCMICVRLCLFFAVMYE